MKTLSIRTRLGLWFGGVLVAIMLFLSATSAYLLFRGMRAQQDADLRRDHKRVEEHVESRPGGKIRLRGSYRYDGHGNDGTQRFLEIVGPEGRLGYSSKRPKSRRVRPPILRPGETSRIRSIRLPDGLRVRRLSRIVVRGGRRYTVHLAHSEKRLWETLNTLLLILSILLPMTLAAAALGGWALARKALQPVQDMTALARQIRAKDLSVRIPVENPDDELGQLAAVLNKMLTRLSAAFENLKRFTSDASHELRTPLATLKTLGEVSLGGDDTADGHRETLVSMLAETNRMAELVDALLMLSRADAGRIELQDKPVDLRSLVEEASDFINVLAEDKGLALKLELDRVPTIHADARLLRQAVINLMHNAIKYTPAPGEIRVSVSGVADEGRVKLEVTDTGIGIDLKKNADIFERFYRVDEDRSRASGGTGLGLAITKWVAQAHGGDLTVSSRLDRGSTFTLSLPLSKPT